MDTNRTKATRSLGLTAGAAAALALVLGTAAGPAGADPSARPAPVTGDTLTINGTSASETLALRLAAGDPNTLQVDFGNDGSAEQSFDRTTFDTIEVFLRSGQDRFLVDQANGTFTDEQLIVDGGSGNDSLDGGDGGEEFMGNSGNDAVDGNRGNDSADLGSGNDSFRWDPGDGSDQVEGRGGTDTLDFNGAGVAENMSLSPNGGRSLFLRDVGNIRMDMDDVERLDLTALGGPDTVTLNDMTGTDFRRAAVDLGADQQLDLVTVNATNRAENIDVDAVGGTVQVDGLQTRVDVSGSDPSDRLQVNALGGNDDVDVADEAQDLIEVSVDLGAGQS